MEEDNANVIINQVNENEVNENDIVNNTSINYKYNLLIC